MLFVLGLSESHWVVLIGGLLLCLMSLHLVLVLAVVTYSQVVLEKGLNFRQFNLVEKEILQCITCK